SLAAMANLAEGIQGLVKNMRNEQQMLRDWIEAQQEESKALRRTLDRLSDKIGQSDKIGSK
ncbi:MAG: flagellar motor protein MotA, partial [Rhizobiaceae bacterium]